MSRKRKSVLFGDGKLFALDSGVLKFYDLIAAFAD